MCTEIYYIRLFISCQEKLATPLERQEELPLGRMGDFRAVSGAGGRWGSRIGPDVTGWQAMATI